MGRRRCLNLQNNSIELVPLKRIIEDVSNLHIENLRLSVDEFYLTMERKRRKQSKNTIEVLYAKEVDKSEHIVSLYGSVCFHSRGQLYKVKIKLTAKAFYNYEPYTSRLQDYLYTYMSYLINTEPKIQYLCSFTCPEHLNSFQQSCPDWRKTEIQNFCWIDDDSYQTIDVVREKNPPIEAIINTPIDMKQRSNIISNETNGYWIRRVFGSGKK